MISCATAPLSPYSSIMASLPAARIMAKDRKVMPSSTGISCKKRLPIYLFKMDIPFRKLTLP